MTETKTQTIVAQESEGIQEFYIQPGVHTVVLDTRVLRQRAIADFVNELSNRNPKHSSNAYSEDVALAIGWFGVPLKYIYDEEDITKETDLDDFTLVNIIRYRAARIEFDKEQKEKKND